ncbi:acyltransferase family protein [Clostridium saccharoperbutylacetonicum]|uniref:acyltransferase family protein n=1 Tax=Clostridium saccharoperbutylacetonicum TaxID=36745 RepID=UPI00156DAC4C|nr:acyltransferase [Clostridium saccharoperbutylacetonicum]NSB23372.1 peptidoglycan/LPS O-acetylase OafA/YrhL [Clostridium saccharoperbutylacetonicum]
MIQNEKSLDGLRGLAAFIVIIHHYLVGFYPSTYTGNINSIRTSSGFDALISRTPFNLFFNGNASVCMFFILSGYVLSCKFFKYKEKNIVISSAIRRYLRLMIPVLSSIVLVFILMKFKLFYNIQASTITGSDWWLGSFYNFEPNTFEMLKQGLYRVFFFSETSYNAVLWTMHYELFGSFIVFGFLFIFGKIKTRVITYIVIIFLLFNTYYLAFILGMFLSDIHSVNCKLINKINFRFPKIFFLITGLYLCSYPSGVDVTGSIYNYIKISKFNDVVMLYHIIGSFFIMITLLNSYKLKNFFSNKIFLFLGKISFSMYLIHLIVLCSFSSFIFLNLINYFRYYQTFFIMLILSIPLIILISHCFINILIQIQ